MLCISLLPNDYFTIGDDVVVQFGRLVGERVHLTIQAPREVPIVRGQVLERQGRRPGCVMDKSPRYVRQLPWNPAKKAALGEIRAALAKSLEVNSPSSSGGTNCRKSSGRSISNSCTSSVGMRS